MASRACSQGARAAAGVAYGLEFVGAALGLGPVPAGLMVPGEAELPKVAIDHDPNPADAHERVIDAGHAHFQLADGRRTLSLSRAGARAVFHGPELSPDQLVHPYLGRVASVYTRWLGREAFHGGALIGAGGAWPVLGPSHAGKSTLLAAFAARGGEVLADDLVVVENGWAFAGPRCVDLREPSVRVLEEALPLGSVRSATRRRAALPPVAVSLPLAGWVFLSWGERIELRPISAAECLGRLAGWRARPQLHSDPAQMLALAGVPAYVLSRPRGWEALAPTLECLARTLTSPQSAAPAAARLA